MRIDIMSRMRGMESFTALWQRRTTFDLPSGLSVETTALPDLVQAKKTQRDKEIRKAEGNSKSRNQKAKRRGFPLPNFCFRIPLSDLD
jgi:hypothetical protein